MEKTAMKNITTIEKTAMPAIAKITAKITTTALLLFLALFTLTTNLKAQAVQKQQIWFLRWVCVFAGLSGRQQQKYF